MKYDTEIGSGVMIYVHTKFHKDWFRHSKLMGRGGIQRRNDFMHDFISLFSFFNKITEVG
jgi:hypothetical protein